MEPQLTKYLWQVCLPNGKSDEWFAEGLYSDGKIRRLHGARKHKDDRTITWKEIQISISSDEWETIRTKGLTHWRT